jgi:hypothetical protein
VAAELPTSGRCIWETMPWHLLSELLLSLLGWCPESCTQNQLWKTSPEALKGRKISAILPVRREVLADYIPAAT